MISLWEEKDIPGFDPELSEHIPAIIPYIIDTQKPTGAVIVFPGEDIVIERITKGNR